MPEQDLIPTQYVPTSLYHYAIGEDVHAHWLRIVVLQLTPRVIGRFRDAFLNEDGTRILVCTRNGGAQRVHDRLSSIPASVKCPCIGCIMHYTIRNHPCYLSDCDDATDTSYATITFRTPDAFLAECKSKSVGRKPLSIAERMAEATRRISELPATEAKNPRYAPLVNFFQNLEKNTAPVSNLFDEDRNWLSFFFAGPKDGCCSTCWTAPGSKRCSRCKHARYCSAACQKLAWPRHRKVCVGKKM